MDVNQHDLRHRSGVTDYNDTPFIVAKDTNMTVTAVDCSGCSQWHLNGKQNDHPGSSTDSQHHYQR